MRRRSGLWRACLALVRRDLLCVSRHRAEAANPLLFFAMVATLFPIALGPDPKVLAAIGPGAIWASALLSTLVSLEGMFRPDLEDGSIEQLLLSPHPLAVLVTAKVCAHWLATGLPLLLLAPLLALQFGLGVEATGTLLLSLVLGTPALSLLGAVGVALTVGLRGAGLLLALLLLPLYLPILIFATGAGGAVERGLAPSAHLNMLTALLVLALTLAPLAAAAALRVRG
ncbi:MAG: heme exporter protein CcmB [Gammaproteobacteria bacterium]